MAHAGGSATARPFFFPHRLLLIDELRETWRSEPSDHRFALLAIIAVGVVLRALHLGQPMRYDEAVTYMYFVRLPWSEALSTYTYPNNHLFHTALAKAAVSVFGNTPWALRLPAFVAGTVVIPATYVVARILYNARTALVAAAIVAASGALAMYSTNARGYTIVVLAFLLLVIQASRLLRGSPSGEWMTFAVVAALGLWTIPVMLYPFGAVCVWVILSALVAGQRRMLRPFAIALGIAAGLTLLAYAPVVSHQGLGVIIRNQFVVSSGWYEFLRELPSSFGDALSSWSLGIPPLVGLILLWCAAVALRHHATLSSFSVGVPLAVFVWSAWLLVRSHRAPFPRVWLWLLPVVACLAAAGALVLLERWTRTRQLVRDRGPVLATALALALAVSVTTSHAVLLTTDTGTFRDAAAAANALSRVLRPGDRILASIPTNGPLMYYLDRHGVDPAYLTRDEASARRFIVVVDAAEGQTLRDVLARSVARDGSQFAEPTVLARFPASTLVLFERRDVQTK